ncbi:MAG: GNAT family N-acetyltransferase [Hyphomonadaceae bacterium]
MRLVLAQHSDIPAIKALMALSMDALLPEVLTPEQAAKSSQTMGLDTQLIDDGTYYLVYIGHQLVGCGGWSRRRTLYGGNHTHGRDDALADPKTEPAKIRAMYTHPDFTRRGIGRALLEKGEDAARNEGFSTIELGATASGTLLYEVSGYAYIEDLSEPDEDGVIVPILRMRKVL